MAMQQITLSQLNEILLDTIKFAKAYRPLTGEIFQLLYNTGLRAGEALAVERWAQASPTEYSLQLEKGEGTRQILRAAVPPDLQPYYDSSTPFELQTYSSINNTFKYYTPGLIFGADTRRTTSHAFRYRFMMQLKQEGQTTAQIAATMGHLNLANTARYVNDEIYSGQ